MDADKIKILYCANDCPEDQVAQADVDDIIWVKVKDAHENSDDHQGPDQWLGLIGACIRRKRISHACCERTKNEEPL